MNNNKQYKATAPAFRQQVSKQNIHLYVHAIMRVVLVLSKINVSVVHIHLHVHVGTWITNVLELI